MAYKPSAKIRKMKRRKIMKKYFFHYFSPLFFILAFLFFMYSIPTFHIRNISVVGTTKTNSSSIKKAIKQKLSERYLFILDKDHIWFYPTEEIKDKILKLDPRIKSVDIISKNWWRDLEIKIKERNEKYLWCLIVDDRENEKCFLMDESADIFSPTEGKEGLIKFYGSPRKFQEQIIEIEKMISFLANYKLNVKKISHDEINNLIFILDDNSKLLLPMTFESHDLFRRLEIIFSYKDFKIEKGRFKNKVTYINLRHGNKIYYCLNDNRCTGNY